MLVAMAKDDAGEGDDLDDYHSNGEDKREGK